MHYSTQLSDRRLRSSRRIARRPLVRDLHSGNDRTAVIPFARDGAPGLRTSAVSTRLVKTAAAFAYIATEAVCDLLLAITSIIIAEAMAGCAAYAEALYPIPPALGPSEPVPAPVPRATSDGLSAQKPNLRVIDSKDGFGRRAPHLQAGLPARTAAIAIAPGDRGRVARPRWYVSLGALIAACWSRIRKAREQRQAIAELRGMDQRSLRDIGLSAADIEYIARHGDWRE
jgi:uncharacterized protein YjiS (DUF1127 family)